MEIRCHRVFLGSCGPAPTAAFGCESKPSPSSAFHILNLHPSLKLHSCFQRRRQRQCGSSKTASSKSIPNMWGRYTPGKDIKGNESVFKITVSEENSAQALLPFTGVGRKGQRQVGGGRHQCRQGLCRHVPAQGIRQGDQKGISESVRDAQGAPRMHRTTDDVSAKAQAPPASPRPLIPILCTERPRSRWDDKMR